MSSFSFHTVLMEICEKQELHGISLCGISLKWARSHTFPFHILEWICSRRSCLTFSILHVKYNLPAWVLNHISQLFPAPIVPSLVMLLFTTSTCTFLSSVAFLPLQTNISFSLWQSLKCVLKSGVRQTLSVCMCVCVCALVYVIQVFSLTEQYSCIGKLIKAQVEQQHNASKGRQRFFFSIILVEWITKWQLCGTFFF